MAGPPRCTAIRELLGGQPSLTFALGSTRRPHMKRINYRKLAFEHYRDRLFCAHCGFGLPDILEVAHLDCCRDNNDVSNLVLLCPTCHKMFDLDLISTETMFQMHDRPRVVRWSKRMKDAGRKAAETRRNGELARRRKRRLAGLKAAATRARNRAQRTAAPNGSPATLLRNSDITEGPPAAS
jgi:HNH endonuclease